MFDETQKNFLIDMIRTEGWRIFSARNKEEAAEYRKMATQPPEAITDAQRTYFSGLAQGREDAVDMLVDLFSKK